MNLSVIVAYRYIFATVFIAPLAFIIERKRRTKMSWTILFQSFLCGLIGGALPQNLNMEAIALTSVTFTTAISNLVPAITFMISLFFGLERLNLRTRAGKAKILGTITGISGAMILTFVKGPEVKMLSFHQRLLCSLAHHSGHFSYCNSLSLYACRLDYLISNFGFSGKDESKVPCPYSSTALMSLMGALLSISFAFCVERDFSQWRLGCNVRLLTVAYAV
uniref:WAT1-related protein n=1 Tax=Cajanus cajan TaxID=3821 RepID=A0A151T7U9_CAJCA|nr:Auxin-induced protein 5NG4 [Cajanus cajan]